MVSFANAQKGTYLVSGNVNYYSNKNSNGVDYDSSNFSFSPKLGYQFADNWTLGVQSSIGQNKSNSTYSTSKEDNFSIGSFLRYSKSINDLFSFFTDLNVGFQNQKVIRSYTDFYEFSEFSQKANGFYASLQPMIHLKIKNNFGVNFGLGGIGYSSIEDKKTNNTNSTFSVSFGQAYTIGIQKNF